MRSRKCEPCGVYWPLGNGYGKCPACEVPTQPTVHQPMPTAEAERLLNIARFERFYARHDGHKRLQGLPTPEEVAHLEVEEMRDLDRRAAA